MSFFGSSSSSNSGSFPHDVKTQSGLTSIYNEKVVSATRVTRPTGSFGPGSSGSSSFGWDPTSHSGVVVKTESGKEWLVHKGQDYGKSSATVVVDTKHMSDKWTRHETQSAGGKNVGSFVETGGSNFNLLSDNCHQSAKRMMK